MKRARSALCQMVVPAAAAASLVGSVSGGDEPVDRQCVGWNSAEFFRTAVPAEREQCIDVGDLSQVDVWGNGPIHAAVADSSGRSLARLVERGADVNQQSGLDGATPLMHALKQSHRDGLVRVALTLGADPDISDDDGRTALARAVELGHDAHVTVLLAAGATADMATDEGKTPLYLAVEQGSAETVRRLLAHGADPDGDPRYNPLEKAVRSGAAELASALLEAGADPNGGYDVPMVAAASNGDVASLEELHKQGADVNRADWMGRTPLRAAVHGYEDDTVGWLLDAGAVPRATGLTALHWLMYTEPPSLTTLESLLAAGADPCAADRRGSQPLHYIARLRSVDDAAVVDRLLKAGADPLASNELGATPLHIAALGSSVEVLNALLTVAAPNVDPVDARRRTPLHYAAVADRDLSVIEALLRAGASLDTRDVGNKTPHALAEYWSTKPFVVRRLARGPRLPAPR